jgi:tetratricopeptide (TPR) repeat protein
LAKRLAAIVVEVSTNARELSFAHQAMAIVERDTGHLRLALTHAETALRASETLGRDRRRDVLATLGVTLAYAGRPKDGLKRLEEAEQLGRSDGDPWLNLRRAHVLYVAGRYEDALIDVDRSLAGSHRAQDHLWEARGLNTRCIINLALGDVTSAERDARAAEEVFDRLDQKLESAHSVHNRAIAAHHRGDLPEALRLMDVVTERYAAIEVAPSDLVIDHAQTLLTAGLTQEARSMTAAALAGTDLPPVKRAEILLTAAQAALLDGDVAAAHGDANFAGRLFAAQERPRWSHRAQLLALQTRYLAEHPELQDPAWSGDHPNSPAKQRQRHQQLLKDSEPLLDALTRERAAELAVAQVLHGRIARDAGMPEEAQRSFEQAARSRHTGSALARAAGWLAAALLADLREDRRALLYACRRGLDAVDEYRALLGDLELRALATRHGNELLTLAMHAVKARGDARGMLWWIERWRATALATPGARPLQDKDLQRKIAALRDVDRRLDAGGTATENLRQERARLETEVRRVYRRQPAEVRQAPGATTGDVLASLVDTVLVVPMYLDGVLYALTASDGRVRRRVVGPLADALREAKFARFALRRAAYGRDADVAAAASRLQTALLGKADSTWSGRRTVLIPPADLLTAPWGLLPALADAELTVSPSMRLWAVARGAPPSTGHIALVTGPGLSTGETEVTALSPVYHRARAIGGEGATVEAALQLLDGAGLAHIAAHGAFRADAPLFSSLLMADGPLHVHDLDRLQRPPHAMVLSACDSGNAAPIGPSEALGLVTSLLAMGTRTVIASVVPVNDRATIEVMRIIHEVVGAGGSLAQGWLRARQAADDPLHRATAAAFTAWGA